jgi:hypothetical protein
MYTQERSGSEAPCQHQVQRAIPVDYHPVLQDTPSTRPNTAHATAVAAAPHWQRHQPASGCLAAPHPPHRHTATHHHHARTPHREAAELMSTFETGAKIWAKGSAGVSKSLTSLKSNQQQQKSSASCGGLVVFPRQRPPSRTPQLRRGARAAAGCERSSAGPRGGRSTLPAHPRPVVSGASSRW